jgi:hypothetical protein
MKETSHQPVLYGPISTYESIGCNTWYLSVGHGHNDYVRRTAVDCRDEVRLLTSSSSIQHGRACKVLGFNG